MKTCIVITGNHEATNERYEEIVNTFHHAGWDRPLLYEPNWDRSRISDLVNDFLEFIPEDNQPLTLLGFSLGAMIALVASSRIKVDDLVLCSPSGYFKEYAAALTPKDRQWALQHLNDFEAYSAPTVIGRAQVGHGYIIAGQNELAAWPDFKQWINDLKAQTSWSYAELPHVGHEIENTDYQVAIKHRIMQLTR